MFLFNIEDVKNIIILDNYDNCLIVQKKFPMLGIRYDGRYIFKKNKKICDFLKENNISFVEG